MQSSQGLDWNPEYIDKLTMSGSNEYRFVDEQKTSIEPAEFQLWQGPLRKKIQTIFFKRLVGGCMVVVWSQPPGQGLSRNLNWD